MIIDLLYKFYKKELFISKIIMMYVILLILGIIPDYLHGNFIIGIPVMITCAIPLFMFLYVYNNYRNSSNIGYCIFKIPIVYGCIISLMGIIQEFSNFIGVPLEVWGEYIGKTDNFTYMCSIFGIPMGAYSSWGIFLGKNILRIQGFYIEASKMAMFLMIPVFYLTECIEIGN